MIETKNFGFYVRRIIMYSIIIFFAFIFIVPFWYMFTAMFRTNAQISGATLPLIPELGFGYVDNIVLLFERGFLRNLTNSLIVAVIRTLLTVLFCCMAGLAFAKYRFPLRNGLLYAIILTMMIPMQIGVIPSYLIMVRFGWLNTFQALIMPGLASAFGIFLMRQYMAALPDDILDSTKIDGLNQWGFLFYMAIPLTQSGIVVLSIISFMGAWNDYFWPLIVTTREEMYTATLRLAALNDTGLFDINPFGMIFAGAFISSLPMFIIFIIFRNKMLSGILAGSVKG